MSWTDSNEKPARRRRRRRRGKGGQDWRGLEAWEAGEEEAAAEEEVEEEAWARSPSPRRGRWEPEETEAGPSVPWDRRRSPSPRGSWAGRPRSPSPVAPWDSRKAWGRPPSEASESLEERGRQLEPRTRGGRWSNAEKLGRVRRRPPSPEAPSWQRSPNGDATAWRSPDRERAWESPGREQSWESARNAERQTWGEPRRGSRGGAGGRWASAGSGKEPSQSPSRERRSLGSSGRDVRQEGRGSPSDWDQPSREQGMGSSAGASGRWGRTARRGRGHWNPSRKQSGWGGPQSEARQELWGSTRYHAREQGQVSPEEPGRRGRERNYLDPGREEGSSHSLQGGWQSPNEEARGQGSPRRYRGAENPDGGDAERNSYVWGDEEKRMEASRSDSPEASAPFTGLISSSSAVPKEWTPRESVLQWWSQCRSTLQKRMREQLMSLCPRPTLPDRSSETPQVNPQILSLLNSKQEKELRGATRVNVLMQEEVLDLLAPVMTIYEMAEESMEKDVPVDPMELREWSRHLLRFIGSINNRLIYQHRSQVLGCINPRLRMVVSKMSGQSTEGMLFSEDKVKLLKEIILRFPQLTETRSGMPRKKFYPYPQVASYKLGQRRPILGSRFKPVRTGKRGTAGQEVEQSHSQGAREEDPAEWH